MIGDNIKKLRNERNMTQKDLADLLYLTPQAISRWENGETEPPSSMVAKISTIFNVPTDVILGIETVLQNTNAETQESSKKATVEEPPAPMLAVCEKCNSPIYSASEIVRTSAPSHSVYCLDCHNKMLAQKKQEQHDLSKHKRKKSFILAGLAFALFLAIAIACVVATSSFASFAFWAVIGVMAFTLISCLILSNNFIGEMMGDIFSWAFVRMPGIIFELDLDGIIWLLTVKLLFWILQFLLSCVVGILAISIGAILSVFVYPFAIHRSINAPELTEDD